MPGMKEANCHLPALTQEVIPVCSVLNPTCGPFGRRVNPLAWGPPALSGITRIAIDKVAPRLFPIPASKCHAVASLAGASTLDFYPHSGAARLKICGRASPQWSWWLFSLRRQPQAFRNNPRIQTEFSRVVRQRMAQRPKLDLIVLVNICISGQ